MTYESKILNVKLRHAKIHYVPDVVYAQVPTFESSGGIGALIKFMTTSNILTT